MIGGAIPPTGFAPSWTRLNNAEIRMTGSISPRAKAALAAIRVIFRVARIARNFDIERLYLSMAPAKSVQGRRSAMPPQILLLQKSDNPAFFCMIFAFFEEIDGSPGCARCPGSGGGNRLFFGRRPRARAEPGRCRPANFPA